MSLINGNIYFGSVGIVFNESGEMVINQQTGDYRILQMLVEGVKRLVFQ